MVQNQWLNLYLFDRNNFTLYKFLYYFSGIIFPCLVWSTSLNKFTFYKFNNYNKIKRINYITGKRLLFVTVITLLSLTTLLSIFISLNFKIFFNLFLIDYSYLLDFYINKQIIFVILISILLLFKKTKILIKKSILLNYFIISLLIWYSNINNISFNNIYLFKNLFKFDNLNYINIFILLAIEILYYLWSYITHNSNLSDWNVPILSIEKAKPLIKIIFFYIMVLIYYSILFN